MDVITLVKPRITALVLLTTAVGLYLAPGTVELQRALFALVGTVLMVAGANVLNMYVERDSDGLMARTKDRPLPARRLQPKVALRFGILLALASTVVLFAGVNRISGALAVFSFVVYVLVYTPLKRVSDTALQIGGVSGAMPPVIGWASVTGAVELPSLVLFAIIFLWQVPHFLAISLYCQGDYKAAGIKVFSLERGEEASRWAIIRYTVALVLVSLFVFVLQMAGAAYLVAALILGGVFLGWGLVGLRHHRISQWAHVLFLISLCYLTVLFVVMVLDKGTSKNYPSASLHDSHKILTYNIMGCSSIPSAPLPVLGDVPSFHLIDQTGTAVSRENLLGKVWVADFIFTSCTGVCPLLTHKMSGIQGFLSQRGEDGVKLVSFSVDPETDTPERLARYAESFRADPVRWHFLTGPKAAVEAVVMQGFKISMGQVPKEGETGFEVVHGESFVLVDRLGRIRSYSQSSDESLKSLRRDLLRLAREK